MKPPLRRYLLLLLLSLFLVGCELSNGGEVFQQAEEAATALALVEEKIATAAEEDLPVLEEWQTAAAQIANTLVASTASPPTSQGLRVGGMAVVSNTGGQRLMCRVNPDTDAEILERLNAGTEVTVVDGPRENDGYLWWKVKPTDRGSCWAVGDWLFPLSPPPPVPLPVPTPVPPSTPANEICFLGQRFGVREDEEGVHHYVEFQVDLEVKAKDWYINKSPIFPKGDLWAEPDGNGVAQAGFPWPDRLPVVIIQPDDFLLCGRIE